MIAGAIFAISYACVMFGVYVMGKHKGAMEERQRSAPYIARLEAALEEKYLPEGEDEAL